MMKSGRKTAKKSRLPLHHDDKPPKTVKKSPAATAASQSLRSFPLSPWMVLASFLFWTCMILAAYKLFLYYGVHKLLNDSDLEGYCDATFHKNMEENMKVVSLYNKGDSGPYLNRIGSEKFKGVFQGEEAPKELEKIPPIVTAVASSDFWIVQGLIEQIVEGNKKNLDLQLIVYDVGLYESEHHLLVKYCKCEVRKFEFSVYPAHVGDVNNKAYRPIILQMILEEFQSAVWFDPDVRIQAVSDLSMMKYRGQRDFFLWEYPVFTSVVAYTDPATFSYLNEKRCTFIEATMVDTKTMVLYRTNATWEGIMKPFLKCALSKDCISPPNARSTECFHYKKPKSTGCHWYDQSVLSIIMNRVFQFSLNPDKYKVPRFTLYNDVIVTYYFPEQPWTYAEISLMMVCPLLCLGALWYMYLKRKATTGKSFYSKR